MARGRVSDVPLGELPALTGRIVHLSKVIWEGNRTRMGRDLGHHVSVVSRVLSGDQDAPAKMLEALARWPRVNARWLFTGQGEPLDDPAPGTGGGGYCPVAETLLPGDPEQHPHLLAGGSRSVAAEHYTPKGYWFRASRQYRFDKKTVLVEPGDLLFMDPRESWTQSIAAVAGRICALRVPTTGRVVLGIVNKEFATPWLQAGETAHRVATFGEYKDAALISGRLGQEGLEAPPADAIRFTLGDVLAVCVQQCRYPRDIEWTEDHSSAK